MWWFLVITFLYNGEVVDLKGWEPLPTESANNCNKLKENTIEYLGSIDIPYEFTVECKNLKL